MNIQVVFLNEHRALIDQSGFRGKVHLQSIAGNNVSAGNQFHMALGGHLFSGIGKFHIIRLQAGLPAGNDYLCLAM